MNPSRMRRMTGAFGLASVGIWLALFPLYTMQPPASLYDGAATARALYTIRNVVFTRVLLGVGLYVTLTPLHVRRRAGDARGGVVRS